jgi:hypothetical protein
MTQTTLLPNETNLEVGTTAMMGAIPANPTRSGLIICNNGTDTVNVTFGQSTPSATTGIPLTTTNPIFTLLPRNEQVALGAQLNFIAASADTPVSVMEF